MFLLTARGVKALAFKNVDLLYVHCVSEEKFTVRLKGFTCVTLVCRETHVSYLVNMSERRRCLIPDVVENQSVDVLLEGRAAPLLVRVNSSCDITVSCELMFPGHLPCFAFFASVQAGPRRLFICSPLFMISSSFSNTRTVIIFFGRTSIQITLMTKVTNQHCSGLLKYYLRQLHNS